MTFYVGHVDRWAAVGLSTSIDALNKISCKYIIESSGEPCQSKGGPCLGVIVFGCLGVIVFGLTEQNTTIRLRWDLTAMNAEKTPRTQSALFLCALSAFAARSAVKQLMPGQPAFMQ